MTWPNLLSALRLGMIPFFVIALVERRPGLALVLFAVAGLTDLLDGFIARFFNQQSVLGAFLDPMADKLMMTAAFVTLAIPDVHPGRTIPIWIAVLVISRDVLIVIIALILYLAIGITEFKPSWLSKWNTAFQIGAVTAVLLTGISPGFDLLAIGLLYAVVPLTWVSGLEYAYRFVVRESDLTPPKG